MNLEQSSIRFAKLLIILMPLFLITGSFLPDLAVTIIGLFFLFICYKYKKFKYFNNFFFYYLFLIYFYINFSSLFSFDPSISLATSLSFFRIVLFVICLSFFFSEYKDLKSKIFYVYFFCLIFLFIDSTFQLFYGYNLLGYKQIDVARISSVFGRKHIMGSYVARLLPLFLAISFLIFEKNKQTIINILLLTLSGLLIVFSGERLAFFYYLFTIIFYFYFLRNKKILIFYLFFFFSITSSLYIYNPSYINRIFKHTYDQLNEVKHVYSISYRHNLHYLTAYNIFLDNKLLGAGVKSFRYLCSENKYAIPVKEKIVEDNTVRSAVNGRFVIKKDGTNITKFFVIDNFEKTFSEGSIYNPNLDSYTLVFFAKNGEMVKKDQPIYSLYDYLNGCNTHPHNIYMQFLSELGIIGFSIFILFFFYIIFNLLKLIMEKFKSDLSNNKKAKAMILVGALVTMLPFLPSGNYFNNWMLIISYLPFGLFISLNDSK